MIWYFINNVKNYKNYTIFYIKIGYAIFKIVFSQIFFFKINK